MANESSWDDGLPLRMDGYDPYGGIYQGGLNFEMYWDDNEDKYERFVTTLDQADYDPDHIQPPMGFDHPGTRALSTDD